MKEAAANPFPVEVLSNAPKGGSILDVGCFVHSVLFECAAVHDGQLIAVDNQPGLEEALRKQTDRWEEFSSRMKCVEVDVASMQMAVGNFAAVIARDVLHFVSPEQRQEFYHKAMEWLMPGGVLYIRMHNHNTPLLSRSDYWNKVGIDEYHGKSDENERCYPARINEASTLQSMFRDMPDHCEFEDAYIFQYCGVR